MSYAPMTSASRRLEDDVQERTRQNPMKTISASKRSVMMISRAANPETSPGQEGLEERDHPTPPCPGLQVEEDRIDGEHHGEQHGPACKGTPRNQEDDREQDQWRQDPVPMLRAVGTPGDPRSRRSHGTGWPRIEAGSRGDRSRGSRRPCPAQRPRRSRARACRSAPARRRAFPRLRAPVRRGRRPPPPRFDVGRVRSSGQDLLRCAAS